MLISDDLRRGNVAAVVRALLVEGPLARAELAERLSLTRPTLTRVAAQLIELGLVKEGEPRRPASGRPLVPLELNGSSRAVVSVHIGAIEMRIGIVDLLGNVEREDRYDYRGTEPAAVASLISEAVANLHLERQPSGRILGLSSSIGGWVDPQSQVIVDYAPLGWKDVPLADIFPDVGLPRRADQLVSALALAERMFGVARDHDDFVVLWTGNVLGAASVVAGGVRRGLRSAAGVIDHLPTPSAGDACTCGRTNCLAMAVTDAAILRTAVTQGIADEADTLRDVIQRAAAGDASCISLIETTAATFGHAAGIIADLQAPPLMILAGLVTTADGYQDAFARGLSGATGAGKSIAVRSSEFGDAAPTVASAALLIDEYSRDPLGFEATPLA